MIRRKTQRLKGRSSKLKQVSVVSATISTIAVMSTQQTTVHAATSKQLAFLNQIAPIAKNLAAKNDLYASVMIAQAILESGWGASRLSSVPNYNLFGIKGHYNGQSIQINTLEDDGSGQYYTIQANFRKYPSYLESLQDYANLLKQGLRSNKNFYSGAWKSQTSSYQEATKFLTGKYATDTSYHVKLNRIIEKYNLTQYDTIKDVNSGVVAATVNAAQPVAKTVQYKDNTITTVANAKQKTYTVQKGDSLYKIALNHGITIDELKSLNGLTSNLIHPNQVLKVGTMNSSVKVDTTTKRPVSTVSNTVATKAVSNVEKTYTVQKGDYLYKIATTNGLTANELKTLNGLTSNLIYSGQVLKLTNTANSVSQTVDNKTTSITQQTYVVKSGDSVWRIANMHKISIEQLKQLNHLSSNLIHPGQTLRVG